MAKNKATDSWIKKRVDKREFAYILNNEE